MDDNKDITRADGQAAEENTVDSNTQSESGVSEETLETKTDKIIRFPKEPSDVTDVRKSVGIRTAVITIAISAVLFFAGWVVAGVGGVLPSPFSLGASQGLEIRSNGDGTSTVEGIGKCEDAYVIVPKLSPTGGRITAIADNAFEGKDGIEKIKIPEGITDIGDYAFEGCKNLKYIELPNSLESIGRSAFSGCESLSFVLIPKKIKHIPEYAFSKCTKLDTVLFEGKLTSIGENAFSFCANLTQLELPASVVDIGDFAFADCGLVSVKIPNGVNLIGERVFSACPLKSVEIPKSVTKIVRWAFYGCPLARIDYNGAVDEWNSITKEREWDVNTDSYTVFCTDGVAE